MRQSTRNNVATRRLSALLRAYNKLPWMIGDLLNELEESLGELANAATNVRFSEYVLYDFARMARLWKKEERTFDLPWSYYRDAGGDKEIATGVLAATERLGWSREQMRECVRKVREMESEAEQHGGF